MADRICGEYGTAAMPLEDALMAFAGIDISKAEMGKGVPFLSFVVKEGEGAVLVTPLPFLWQTAF